VIGLEVAMSVDTATAIQSVGSQNVRTNAEVAVIRKIQDQQELAGQAAIRLIESSGPQMVKTADGHISVKA
jgi:hypothetical protein